MLSKLGFSGHKKASGSKPFFTKTRKQYLFVWAVLILPMIQFCIFYVGTNASFIILSFQRYDVSTNKFVWAGFANFKKILSDMFVETSAEFKYIIPNSLMMYAGSVAGMFVSLFVSFYLYKKMLFAEKFKTALLLAGVIPSIVIIITFKYFCEVGYPELAKIITGKRPDGLLSNTGTAFFSILLFSQWVSIGGSFIFYVNQMMGINESVSEAARLDGMGKIKEFFHITLPCIWPTFIVFFTVGFPSLFTGQMNLFSYFGPDADKRLYTFGYYLYTQTLNNRNSYLSYPYLASFGLTLTFIAAPLTLAIRKLMEKFGPSPD